jgi:peptide-methionine (S)-S-oxide reductase
VARATLHIGGAAAAEIAGRAVSTGRDCVRNAARSSEPMLAALTLIPFVSPWSQCMNNVSPLSPATEVAVLGGGCFWCLDAVYRGLQGVVSVESGYAGGAGANPSYEEICTGRTGHAEVVKITFDPAVLSFRDLLTVYFTIHDPTTLDRQGNDVGTQYRSVVFAQSAAQRAVAHDVIRSLTEGKLWDKPIVTEVVDAAPFYPAETYHQDYFERNTNQPYCMFVVAPKVAKFRKAFAERLKQG